MDPATEAGRVCSALKKIIISLFNAPFFSYYCIISLSLREIHSQFQVIPVTYDLPTAKPSNFKSYPIELFSLYGLQAHIHLIITYTWPKGTY